MDDSINRLHFLKAHLEKNFLDRLTEFEDSFKCTVTDIDLTRTYSVSNERGILISVNLAIKI